MSIKITSAVKSGSNTDFYVSGATEEFLNAAPMDGVQQSDGTRKFRTTNKNELGLFRALVASFDNSEQTTQTNQRADRYIERLSVAEARGLNHGRAWYASSHDVDAKSLDPSWEGEAICYVYE